MKNDHYDRVGNYAAALARQMRGAPKRFRLTRGAGGNQDQENARRRRFHERHKTAIGGAPLYQGPGAFVGRM
jgi:hypothetical protein